MATLKRLAEEKKELTQKAIQKAAKKVFFRKGVCQRHDRRNRQVGRCRQRVYLFIFSDQR